MVPFCGLIVEFYYWQAGHSTALARSALMSESPHMTSIPAAIVTLFVGSLDKDRNDWGKRMTDVHRMDHLIHLIMNILLYIWCSLVSMHTGHKYLHTLKFKVRSISRSPQQFSSCVPSNSLAIQPAK